jgi:hypothetical protein
MPFPCRHSEIENANLAKKKPPDTPIRVIGSDFAQRAGKTVIQSTIGREAAATAQTLPVALVDRCLSGGRMVRVAKKS